MAAAAFDLARIRRYYERQTAAFLALGQGGSEAAIHRAVWGPGVTTQEQAFHFVEDQIMEALTRLGSERNSATPDAPAPHVVDLGCGVCGSLTYLASRAPIRGTGITLSPVQARVATDRIRTLGLDDRVMCLEGDYTRLPVDVPQADLAFAIESFVHSTSPESFFAECARVVRPDGILVICDDMRRPTTDPRAGRAIAQFERGWQVHTLLTRDQLARCAEAAGFSHDHSTNLAPWLELARPRDMAIAAFVRLFGWLPLERTPIAHVAGRSALQTCLARGWIEYDLSWFRRAA